MGLIVKTYDKEDQLEQVVKVDGAVAVNIFKGCFGVSPHVELNRNPFDKFFKEQNIIKIPLRYKVVIADEHGVKIEEFTLPQKAEV